MSGFPGREQTVHESWMRNRPFVSAQRRYENARVRESEIRQRLCYECGKVINGDDMIFQHHVVSHEAAFLCYQLYHFEKGNFFGVNEAQQQGRPKASSNERKFFRKAIISRMPKPRLSPKKPKTAIIKAKDFMQLKEPARVQEPKLSSDSEQEEEQVDEDEESLGTVSEEEEENPEELPLESDSDEQASEPGSEEEDEEEEDDDVFDPSAEYTPIARGTSSRGRLRKPKFL